MSQVTLSVGLPGGKVIEISPSMVRFKFGHDLFPRELAFIQELTAMVKAADKLYLETDRKV